jgi:hypothetical protein
VDERGVLDNVGALEPDPEEEPQRGHGVIENRNLRAVLRQKQLKASDFFEAPDVALLGCGANLRIAMSSILRSRTKYVWWTPPDIVVSEGMSRLVANVMEMGTWEDASALIECVGVDLFIEVLKSPPAGVISDRSLAFWHYRLGRHGAPPRSRRRFS